MKDISKDKPLISHSVGIGKLRLIFEILTSELPTMSQNSPLDNAPKLSEIK